MSGPPCRAAVSLAILLALSAARAAAETLNAPGRISEAVARDLDGDGALDLIIAHANRGQRYLSMFRCRSGKYGSQPDQSVTIKPDAIAVSLGNYAPGGELDLVLLARRGFYLYPYLDKSPDAGIQKLFDCELFFIAPHPEETPFWPGDGPAFSGTLDLDGDGLDDFLVPERRSLRLVFQERSEGNAGKPRFGREIQLPVALYQTEERRRESASRRIEEVLDGKSGGSFLSTRGKFPYPMAADFDGDGKKDLLVLRPGNNLEVYRQTPAGGYGTAPAWKVEVPWIHDASGFQAADLNRDGKLDFIANRPLKLTSSEVVVVLQDAADAVKSLSQPAQILHISGLITRPELADVNGDGRLDLLVASYRLDLLGEVKKAAVDEVEITYLVYPGAVETPFERQPGFKDRFTLLTRGLTAGPFIPNLSIGKDLTGDGIPDLLQVDSERSLRLFKGRGGGGIGYDEAKVFAEPIGDPDDIAIRDLDGKPGGEILLRYKDKVLVRRASE